jgi:hypothetical protein
VDSVLESVGALGALVMKRIIERLTELKGNPLFGFVAFKMLSGEYKWATSELFFRVFYKAAEMVHSLQEEPTAQRFKYMA